MAPIAVARNAHHLPGRAGDRQRDAAGQTAMRVIADRHRLAQARQLFRREQGLGGEAVDILFGLGDRRFFRRQRRHIGGRQRDNRRGLFNRRRDNDRRGRLNRRRGDNGCGFSSGFGATGATMTGAGFSAGATTTGAGFSTGGVTTTGAGFASGFGSGFVSALGSGAMIAGSGFGRFDVSRRSGWRLRGFHRRFRLQIDPLLIDGETADDQHDQQTENEDDPCEHAPI